MAEKVKRRKPRLKGSNAHRAAMAKRRRKRMLDVLEKHGGNQNATARELGISRQRVAVMIREAAAKGEVEIVEVPVGEAPSLEQLRKLEGGS